jgi:hypothetical protein
MSDVFVSSIHSLLASLPLGLGRISVILIMGGGVFCPESYVSFFTGWR